MVSLLRMCAVLLTKGGSVKLPEVEEMAFLLSEARYPFLLPGRIQKKGFKIFQASPALSYRLQMNRDDNITRNGIAMNMSSHPMTGMSTRTK